MCHIVMWNICINYYFKLTTDFLSILFLHLVHHVLYLILRLIKSIDNKYWTLSFVFSVCDIIKHSLKNEKKKTMRYWQQMNKISYRFLFLFVTLKFFWKNNENFPTNRSKSYDLFMVVVQCIHTFIIYWEHYFH